MRASGADLGEVTALRAERHPHAEFVSLQSDGVSHDAEEFDEPKTEADDGTSAERDQAESGFLIDLLLQEFIERQRALRMGRRNG